MELRHYETVYIVRPELAEDVFLKVIDKYQGILLERGAKDVLVENKGKRQLKYPIKKCKEGVYIQLNYHATGEVVGIIDKSLWIDESVLRYMTTVVGK